MRLPKIAPFPDFSLLNWNLLKFLSGQNNWTKFKVFRFHTSEINFSVRLFENIETIFLPNKPTDVSGINIIWVIPSAASQNWNFSGFLASYRMLSRFSSMFPVAIYQFSKSRIAYYDNFGTFHAANFAVWLFWFSGSQNEHLVGKASVLAHNFWKIHLV